MVELSTRWVGTPCRFEGLEYGDFFFGEAGGRTYLAVKAIYQAQEWVLLLHDLTGTDTDTLPGMVYPHVLDGSSPLRRLEGQVFITAGGTGDRGLAPLGRTYDLQSGYLGLGEAGEFALYLQTRQHGMIFDLRTGRGIGKPDKAVWLTSWRAIWRSDGKERDLFEVDATQG